MLPFWFIDHLKRNNNREMFKIIESLRTPPPDTHTHKHFTHLEHFDITDYTVSKTPQKVHQNCILQHQKMLKVIESLPKAL